MNLKKKKQLAANTFGVGKERVIFNTLRLDEIKEAITKQDMRDLLASGAISIKEIRGLHKTKKSKSRRRAGSVKKKPKNSKRKYVILTRALRYYISELRKQKKITEEKYQALRADIKNRLYESKSHLKEKLTS